MNVTIENIYLIKTTLSRIITMLENERNLSIRDSHALVRDLKIIESEFGMIEETKNKIINKYSISQGSTEPNIPLENMREYQREFKELLSTVMDLNLMTFDIAVFKYAKFLSPLDIKSLSPLINNFKNSLVPSKPIKVVFGQIRESKVFFEKIVFGNFDFISSMKFFQIIEETDRYQNSIEQHRLNLIDSILRGLPELTEETPKDVKDKILEKRNEFNMKFTDYLLQEIEINIPSFSLEEFERLNIKVSPLEYYNLDYMMEN